MGKVANANGRKNRKQIFAGKGYRLF
jgi:hypothetical protein